MHECCVLHRIPGRGGETAALCSRRDVTQLPTWERGGGRGFPVLRWTHREGGAAKRAVTRIIVLPPSPLLASLIARRPPSIFLFSPLLSLPRATQSPFPRRSMTLFGITQLAEFAEFADLTSASFFLSLSHSLALGTRRPSVKRASFIFLASSGASPGTRERIAR